MEGKKILQERFFGLVAYMSEALDRDIEVVDFLDYGDLLKAFHEDRVDLAFLGPLPYSLLSRVDQGVEPVACFREPGGSSSYTCSLVVSGEKPVDLANAKELHIGLTQPYSTCGYLAVSLMLKQAGRSLEEEGIRYSYAGNHTAAALGVARGEYDLAGVKTVIAERYRHLDLQVIAESPAFPGFGLYANRRELSQQTIHRLREAMLMLDPSASEKAVGQMQQWGVSLLHGTSQPSHCDDASLKGALKGLPQGWSGGQ
jgi:phosphonate transport system substrate-binding protein